MSWSWQYEGAPPEPQGVVGAGDAARRLLDALERMAPSDSGRLMAAANDDLLVLTGAAALLPWADGVQYIAPRPEAGALWLPTAQRPAVPLDLLERAIRRKHLQQPLLLLREPAQLVPLTRLLPVSAALLKQMRDRWQFDLT